MARRKIPKRRLKREKRKRKKRQKKKFRLNGGGPGARGKWASTR